MPFPKVRSHEPSNCVNCEADLDGSWWFESGYPKGRYPRLVGIRRRGSTMGDQRRGLRSLATRALCVTDCSP